MKTNVHLKGHRGSGFGSLSVNAMSTPMALLAALLMASPGFAATAETPSKPMSRPAAPQDEAAKVVRITRGLSDAEVLIRIQQIIAQDQRRLRSLNTRSDQLAREFDAASKLFKRLDTELKSARQAEKPPTGITALEQRWALIRDELDPMLQRRQAMDQQIKILQHKLEKQKKALDVVTLGQVSQSLATRVTPSPPSE
ncbi:MAG: hypothetical protein WCH75_08500, partial [Candidatus Binatia bacterium]